MSNTIKTIVNKISVEIKKLENSDDYIELEKVLQGNSVDKLEKYDKTISEELKIFHIKEYDPSDSNHVDLVKRLRFSKLESIQAEENKQIRSKINDLIKKLRIKSLEENFVFFDSPFEIYEENYSILRDKYLEGEIDLDEADFIKNELNKTLNKKDNRFLLNEKNEKVRYDVYLRINDSIKKSENKKIRFLKEKLKNLGWITKLNEKEYTFEEFNTLNSDAEKLNENTLNVDNANTLNLDAEKLNKNSNKEYPKKIFFCYKAYEYYMSCMQFLNAIDDNNKIYEVFPAKANAVFKDEFFEDKIFKPSLSLKAYIGFLVDEFGYKNTNKLSNPSNQEKFVRNFRSQFPYSEQDE